MNQRSYSDVQRDQLAEGTRMARTESRDPTRKIISRKGPQPADKKPKGHEAFLKQLEASGTEIDLEKCDGSKVTGKVKCSDKYTITVHEASGHDRVIFKHDISEFRALAARPLQ